MKADIHLALLGTSACHLCEEAQKLVQDAINSKALHQLTITTSVIDIIDDDALYTEHSLEIPVLKLESSSRILKWPFSSADIIHLVHEFNMTRQQD